MKILVYGAGVLGSYLAHELHQGYHPITMLARGKRYLDLKRHGLVIQHIKQNDKTVDQIQCIDRLSQSDTYDVVFVVVQYSQIENVIELLAQNKNISTLVLVGNDCRGEHLDYQIRMRMPWICNVYFGFLNCAGHREDEIIYNWHKDSCTVTIGTLNNDLNGQALVNEIFAHTKLYVVWKYDINAWLKCHCALIMPICLAIRYEKGASLKLLHSKTLALAIDAVKELLHMLRELGFSDEIQEAKQLKWSTKKLRRVAAILLRTKTGHIMAVDHALAATEEIDHLATDMMAFADTLKYKVPSMRKLYDIVIRGKDD